MNARFVSLALLSIIAAGCAVPGAPDGRFALGGEATPDRQLLGVAASADGGAFAVRADAPWGALTAAAGTPAGATHLDFLSRKPGTPAPAAPTKVWYTDGVPFEVTFVAASAFAVIDGDASDGKATVGVPAGNWDGYLGTTGKPGGSVAMTDGTYFVRETLASVTAKPEWRRVGVRQLPQPAAWRRGDYKLGFAATGLATGFAMRWGASATAAALPPLPPAIASLAGPDTVVTGTNATLTAKVADPNGDAPALAWSAKAPSGAAANAPTGAASATWAAPATLGTYQLGLAATDAYFTTTANPLPITVVAPATPAPTPTEGPSVNGGGWVLVDGRKVDLQVQARTRAKITDGAVKLTDDAAKKPTRLTGVVAGLGVAKNVATITGKLTDGRAFTLLVTDGGEGAKAPADRVKMAVAGAVVLDGALAGGNFQVR